MIIKLTDESPNGTSFHRHTIESSISQLTEILGDPQEDCNGGDDKVNVSWTCEASDEEGNTFIFTIYDWKEYRTLSVDERVTFHIGGKDRRDTILAKMGIEKLMRR